MSENIEETRPKMDVEWLIREVKCRPAIWDQKCKQYYNRDIVYRMWKEIADVCGMPPEAVRCKWKHLRDNFRKEFKKCMKESGHNDPDKYVSGWVWFNNLRFLGYQLANNKVLTRQKYVNIPFPQYESNYISQNDENLREELEAVAELDDSLGTAEDYTNPLHDGPMNEEKRHSENYNTKLSFDSLDSDSETKFKKRKIFHPERDDTYHFLMSLMVPIKSLPYERQMFVRLKMQELIFSETINNHNNRTPYPVELKAINEGTPQTITSVITSDGSSDETNTCEKT